MVNATEFVAKALSVLGSKYWYGCSGEKPTAALLDAKIKQFPSVWTEARIKKARSEIGKGDHVFDCIGLVRFASNMTKNTAALNTNANKLSSLSPGGAIGTLPEIPGLCLFCPGHVGIYIGGGQVVESWGFQHVAKHPLGFQKWTRWGRIPWVDYQGAGAGNQGSGPQADTEGGYTVRAGDSWWKIAQQQMGNGARCEELAAYNGKTSKSIIRPGDVLKIPGKAPGSKPAAPPAAAGGVYTVRAGDSWWKIAQQQLGNGARSEELAAYNGKTTKSVIHPGDKLKLPGAAAKAAATESKPAAVQESKPAAAGNKAPEPEKKPAAQAETTYTVKQGDSWWKIAKEQLGRGTRFAELAAYNGRNILSAIFIGDQIKIPSDKK